MAQSVGEVALDIVAGKNTIGSTIKSSMSEAQSAVNGGASGISNTLGKIGTVAGAVGKTVMAGIGVASGAVVAMGKSAISAYADYEQLVGGVETLFKDSAKTVIENASKAYTTAGLSANEYMETVTSFSASLLQSLGGDTVKASEMADMAITDMSDNANKMGSDIETLKTAYAGFAKGQFTLLDNLKIGYGGTQEEMKRLLADAEKISGIKYDISSYADIVDAIHVVQTEMGITGTTAKEASTTISGSLATMKGAWQNLLIGMGDDNQNFDLLIDQFVESVSTVGENLLPRIEIALGGVVKLVEGLAPKIIEIIPELVTRLLPSIITASVSLIEAIVAIIPDLVSAIVEQIPLFVEGLVKIVFALVQALPTVTMTLIRELPALIAEIVTVLVTELIRNIPVLIGGFLRVKDDIIGVFSDIKERLSAPFERAKDAIKLVVDTIKGFFTGLELRFPHINMPHFSLSPAGWQVGDLLKGSIPSLSIDWYAKAMNNPMIMTKPTIFGYDAGTGNLLGGGEAGSELIVGTNTLLSMIKSAVASVLGGSNMTIEVPALQNVRAGSSSSDSGLSDKVDRLAELINRFIEANSGDINIPIYLGNELFDEYILGKNDRQRLRSGGRA